MQLTIFTDYGLRCLMYLAMRPERRCSVREISEYYKVSRNHLVKVVHRLAQLGYIESSKGRGGGLMLACDPKKTKLGDIVQALEPHMHWVECFDKEKNTCRITNDCQLKHHLMKAHHAFINTLNEYTLVDTLNKK